MPQWFSGHVIICWIFFFLWRSILVHEKQCHTWFINNALFVHIYLAYRKTWQGSSFWVHLLSGYFRNLTNNHKIREPCAKSTSSKHKLLIIWRGQFQSEVTSFFLYRNIIKCCKKSMTIWSQVLKNRKSGTITFNGFLNTHGTKPTPPNRVLYFRNNISVSTFRITRMISPSRRDQQCLISNRSFLEIWLTSMWMMYNMATRLEFTNSLAA